MIPFTLFPFKQGGSESRSDRVREGEMKAFGSSSSGPRVGVRWWLVV